jgi:hypothetical protein
VRLNIQKEDINFPPIAFVSRVLNEASKYGEVKPLHVEGGYITAFCKSRIHRSRLRVPLPEGDYKITKRLRWYIELTKIEDTHFPRYDLIIPKKKVKIGEYHIYELLETVFCDMIRDVRVPFPLRFPAFHDAVPYGAVDIEVHQPSEKPSSSEPLLISTINDDDLAILMPIRKYFFGVHF